MADKYFITGDIVGADTPNYGEKRVEIGGNSALLVETEVSAGTITLKEKAKTLFDAFVSGKTILASLSTTMGGTTRKEVIACIYASDAYTFTFFWGADIASFTVDSDNGFPTMEISG